MNFKTTYSLLEIITMMEEDFSIYFKIGDGYGNKILEYNRPYKCGIFGNAVNNVQNGGTSTKFYKYYSIKIKNMEIVLFNLYDLYTGTIDDKEVKELSIKIIDMPIRMLINLDNKDEFDLINQIYQNQ